MIGFVRDILRVQRLPCKEHTMLFSRQLDARVPLGIAVGLRIHVLYCVGCRRFRAQIRRLHDLAGGIARELDSGEALPADVRERVLRRSIDDIKK